MLLLRTNMYKGQIQKVLFEPDVHYHYRLQPGDGTAYPFSIMPLNNPRFQDIYRRKWDIHYLLNITMPSIGGSVITSPTDAWGKTPEEKAHNLYSMISQHLKGVHDYTVYVIAAAFLVLAERPQNLRGACEAMMSSRDYRRNRLFESE